MRPNLKQITLLVCTASLFVFGAAGCTFGAQPATALPTLPASATAAATTTSATTSTKVPTQAIQSPSGAKATNVPTKPPATTAVTNSTPAPTQPGVPTSAPTQLVSGPSAISIEPHVLAWDRDAKQVAWYAASGSPQVVVTGGANRVINCGQTPNGNGLILYHGDATAQPILMSLNAATPPVSLGDSSVLACDLSGRTAFSPDGKRLALIKYTADAAITADFTIGTLRILSMPDGKEQTTFDNVTAFDLENDGALMVKFYPNTKNQADRADLTWWDAATNKERALETNFKSLDGCIFASARTVRAGDKVYTSIGEHCVNPITTIYRVLRTDFAGGNTVNFIDKTTLNGKYFSNTNTNDLELLPDGQTLLLAVPNGLTSNLANLSRISLPDGKQTAVLSSVITDQSTIPPLPRRFLFNPQRTQLALVQRNTNGGETLYLYDLSKPTQSAAPVTDANRSNQIIALAWNQAGNRLAYIVTGDDSALGYIDLGGTNKLIARGTFQGLALSPDGQTAATTEPNKVGPGDTRYNLVAIALGDGTKTTIVSGDKGTVALDPLAVR
ncbi:MAG: TolB-like translocation protein [Aggregatilineales bacterium]